MLTSSGKLTYNTKTIVSVSSCGVEVGTQSITCQQSLRKTVNYGRK